MTLWRAWHACVQELLDDERYVEIGAGYTGISVYYEKKLVGLCNCCPTHHPTDPTPSPTPRPQTTPGQSSTSCSTMADGSRSATIPMTTWSAGRSRSTSLMQQRPSGPSASGRSVWNSTHSSVWLYLGSPLSPHLSHSWGATPDSGSQAAPLHRCDSTTSLPLGSPSHGGFTGLQMHIYIIQSCICHLP